MDESEQDCWQRVVKRVANIILTVQMNSGGHQARVVPGEMENKDQIKMTEEKMGSICQRV